MQIKWYGRCLAVKLILVKLLLLIFVQPLLASPFDLNITDRDELEEYISQRNQRIIAEPKNPVLFIERGNARFLNEYFGGAIEDFTKALKLDGSLSEAYFGRGLALGRAGKIEDGIKDLDIYIQRKPKSSIAYTKRGVRYFWLGDQDKAKADYEKAIELDPENAEAYDDLGVIYALRKQYDEAREHFMSAIEYDPSFQKAYYNMALVSYLVNSNQQALIYIINALALSPKSRDSLILKAKILESLGRVEEAVVVLDEAEQLPNIDWSERAPIQ